MLRAFFDDSGSHAKSDVTVMAGLIAAEADWKPFELAWRKCLDDFGLRAMHMSHCVNANREFRDWSRDRRDLAIARFRNVLTSRPILMLASAVHREDWENACRREPVLESLFPTALDFCFHACMHYALIWRRVGAPSGEPVHVTIDRRDQNLPHWEPSARSFQETWSERLTGFAFESATTALPLQAADMIAYEVFVHEIDRRRSGFEPGLRPNFGALLDELQIQGGFCSEQQLIDYVHALVRQRLRMQTGEDRPIAPIPAL
ncbi:MAG: DUF3800 domain-containing protein [Caulobacteraceae bacterium]